MMMFPTLLGPTLQITYFMLSSLHLLLMKSGILFNSSLHESLSVFFRLELKIPFEQRRRPERQMCLGCVVFWLEIVVG